MRYDSEHHYEMRRRGNLDRHSALKYKETEPSAAFCQNRSAQTVFQMKTEKDLKWSSQGATSPLIEKLRTSLVYIEPTFHVEKQDVYLHVDKLRGFSFHFMLSEKFSCHVYVKLCQ